MDERAFPKSKNGFEMILGSNVKIMISRSAKGLVPFMSYTWTGVVKPTLSYTRND